MITSIAMEAVRGFAEGVTAPEWVNNNSKIVVGDIADNVLWLA